MRKTPEDRDEIIMKLRKQGKTLQAIGDIFGLSRERVRQILVVNGVKGPRTLDKKFARV